MSLPTYSIVGPSPKSLVFTVSGMTLEALVARTLRLILPEKAQIVSVVCNIAAKGGTPGTDTLDVTAAGTSLLAATFNLNTQAAGTVTQKDGSALSATAASVAAGTEIRVTTAQSGGTSPTTAGLTVQVIYVPQG